MIIMKVEFHFGLSAVLINYTDFFVWFSRCLFLLWKLIERWSHDFVPVWIAQMYICFYVMKSYTFSLWDSACASFLSPLIKSVLFIFICHSLFVFWGHYYTFIHIINTAWLNQLILWQGKCVRKCVFCLYVCFLALFI